MALVTITLNVIEGKEPAVDLVNKIKALAGEAATVVGQDFELFAKDFLSPLGAQVFSASAPLISQVIDGSMTTAEAETQVLATLTPEVAADAQKAAQVTAQAIAVQVAAQVAQPSTGG